MNPMKFLLVALTTLAPMAASAQCWDSAQQDVSECKVTTTNATNATIPRKLKDRFADVINVRDFGATGAGNVTIDDPAVRAAINAAVAGKSAVFFPPGVYILNGPLEITKSIVLTGSGSTSVIKAVDCMGVWPHSTAILAPIISIHPAGSLLSDVTVEKLTLDGNCASRVYGSEYNAGVQVAAAGSLRSQNIWLRELHILNVSGDGITVRGDPSGHSAIVPSDIFIEDNFVERWHKDRQGIAVVAGSRVSIAHNHVILGIPNGTCSSSTDPSGSNYGIDLETNSSDTGSFIAQVQISNNFIHDCNGGINVSNSNYPSNAISNVIVHDNTLASYSGLPAKPIVHNDLSVPHPGLSGYVEYNNLSDDGFRIYESAFKFWPDGTLLSSKGAYLSSTGVWTNASSKTYKQDIHPLENPLEILRQVDVYQYRYRADHGDDGRTHVGVIAEDLPEEVASADHKGAPTGELIALSLAANRALLEQVEAQQAQLKALNDEVQRLKKQRNPSKRSGND